MPANKQAYLRYQIIDSCLQDTLRVWTYDALLYALQSRGIMIAKRTLQQDLFNMREDFDAPIEYTRSKGVHYTKRFTITKKSVSYKLVKKAYDYMSLLANFDEYIDFTGLICRMEDELNLARSQRKPVIRLDSVPRLPGLDLIDPLYHRIVEKQPLIIQYKPFNRGPQEYVLSPYLLKEYQNRWFLYGSVADSTRIYNLALDRIIDFEDADEDVPFYENPLFDPEHFFDDVIGVTKNINEKPRTIQFWAAKGRSNYIETKPIHGSQVTLQENADGSRIFQIEVVPNPEMYSVFMSYVPDVKIISPDHVKNEMRQKLQEAARQYGI